jgi:DNA-binding GntR family transcriptional regulator
LLTVAEFGDLFDMRMLLEPAAARWAASRATDEQRAQLVTEAARTVSADGDDRAWHAAFTTLDAQMHDLVAQAANSPLLHESITRLHSHLHLHRRYFPYAQTAVTTGEHERIAEAIRDHDADAAEAAMRDHLTHARERHLVAFKQ